MKPLGMVISILSGLALALGLFMTVSLNSDARAREFGEERSYTVTRFIVPGFFGLVVGIVLLASGISKEESEKQKKEREKEEPKKQKSLEGFRRIE